MAIAKTNEFSQQEQDLAAFAKVLSHPARIAIMKVLAKENGCICGRIVEILPLAQATVSQHLKELKNAGLIKGTIEGPKSCYCIDWVVMERLMKDFNGMFSSLQLQKEKSCC
jgi:ArsR family transcriptional regulator, arsenate/arsenite/antimonite-responsive transcriptional repressor